MKCSYQCGSELDQSKLVNWMRSIPVQGRCGFSSAFHSRSVKGNVSCTSIFTNIWLRHTDMNNLEHIANNGTDTTKHTDVYNAQF